MNIIVLKFGGTSVANNEKLNIVSNKITTLYDEGYDVVVVVSAQGKRTDALLKEAYEISKNPNSRELDVLLSTGEQESIAKLGILLNKRGYKSVSLTGWQAGIYTNKTNQNAIIEHIDSKRIKTELQSGKIVIVAGFQGINKNLDITTLGRGGSDTTAVAIAAELGAKCYIYSDVEGVFTADPRKMPDPIKLKSLSYDEMLDISNEGAKVLHNRCVELAKKYDIPIIAKSTFSNEEGTNINNTIEAQKVKSLVKNDDLLILHIFKENCNYLDIYKLFIVNDISPIEFISSKDEYRVMLKLSDYNKVDYIMKHNLADADISIKRISRLSVIGYGIANDTKIIKEVIGCLKDVDCLIHKIDINNGKIRITFKKIVPNDILEKLHLKLI